MDCFALNLWWFGLGLDWDCDWVGFELGLDWVSVARFRFGMGYGLGNGLIWFRFGMGLKWVMGWVCCSVSVASVRFCLLQLSRFAFRYFRDLL